MKMTLMMTSWLLDAGARLLPNITADADCIALCFYFLDAIQITFKRFCAS